jgi:hypothetical protein
MAIAGAKIRSFPNLNELEAFIKTEAGVGTIHQIFQDNNGQYVIVYS